MSLDVNADIRKAIGTREGFYISDPVNASISKEDARNISLIPEQNSKDSFFLEPTVTVSRKKNKITIKNQIMKGDSNEE